MAQLAASVGGCWMLEWEKRASANSKLSASARARIAEAQKRRWQKFRETLAPANRPPRAPQPPCSPLCDKLVENIGHQFRDEEARFVRQVQTSFANARVRKLTETDLGLMAGRSNAYDYWKPLDLWRDFPSDDFYFWLYVAFELRLAVGAEEARLQWRSDANAGFAELKQAQARRIAEQFEKGALAIAPNSLPLWGAAYRPWRYESWWLFRYANATARPGLNRLLRMPLAPDRVVTDDGQPLARVAEPLRLNLRLPKNGDGSYKLALGTSDGSPPPKILCALAGQPTLYLTDRGLFAGPLADALDAELAKTIPAPALETAAGLRFLHAAGIPLPEHLSQRIRIVSVSVTISCALRPGTASSQIEDIVLGIAAKAPGMKPERFTPTGWEVEGGNKARGNSEPANGIVIVYDRAAQKYLPSAIELLELKWQNYSGEWTLRLIKKTPELFVSWLQSLPPEIEVLLDKELATLRDAPVSGNVSLDVAEAGIDWFDLKVALKASDTMLTPQELKLLLNARGGYVRFEKKGWRRLQFSLTPEDDEQLARLGIDARDFSAEPQRFHALQLADEAAKKFLAPERVEEIQRRASELKTRVAPPLPPTIRAEMRPYQTEGFHFLAYLASNRFGGVLADDMGLGKKLQT